MALSPLTPLSQPWARGELGFPPLLPPQSWGGAKGGRGGAEGLCDRYVIWVDHRLPDTAPDIFLVFLRTRTIKRIYLPIMLKYASP